MRFLQKKEVENLSIDIFIQWKNGSEIPSDDPGSYDGSFSNGTLFDRK
ncbi:hypothetical protein [Desulfatirhabdium butyrativorans]|nr:hypothetical protein [Desulfatirhabdium butyrativorans]